jgi:hypothetical protein
VLYQGQGKPQTPYRWRANNGSLMELGPDGVPRVAYQDPTPKTEWIQVKDPATGKLELIAKPVGGSATPVVLTDDDWGDTPQPGQTNYGTYGGLPARPAGTFR